jgi:hypothetical protein
MSDQPTDGERSWVSRLGERGAERRAIRADRRARRRARSSMGASPDDAARRPRAATFKVASSPRRASPSAEPRAQAGAGIAPIYFDGDRVVERFRRPTCSV